MAEILIEVDRLFNSVWDAVHAGDGELLGQKMVTNDGIVNSKNESKWTNTYNCAQIVQVTMRLFFANSFNIPFSDIRTTGNSNAANKRNGMRNCSTPPSFPDNKLFTSIRSTNQYLCLKIDQMWEPRWVQDQFNKSLRGWCCEEHAMTIVQRAVIYMPVAATVSFQQQKKQEKEEGDYHYNVFLIVCTLSWEISGSVYITKPKGNVTCTGYRMPIQSINFILPVAVIKTADCSGDDDCHEDEDDIVYGTADLLENMTLINQQKIDGKKNQA